MYMVDTKGRFRGYPEKARGEGFLARRLHLFDHFRGEGTGGRPSF